MNKRKMILQKITKMTKISKNFNWPLKKIKIFINKAKMIQDPKNSFQIFSQIPHKKF